MDEELAEVLRWSTILATDRVDDGAEGREDGGDERESSSWFQPPDSEIV